ncbi:putative 50S ribosome-binding GTPase [Lyophyllum shimeji]|uniref:50S ribosome-binding GTPase n=1 Tax=Lyophyllum shimeji TaxID=47721 RepID=A0A9P3ULU9_LYOSH|nr:putative 50S ribosome-binding GTPase [Lyophyllum shimeji]
MDFTPQANDIVIPIMGITGSGKTTFINTLVPDARLAVGGDIDACTEEVQAAVVAHPQDPAYRIVFVDTPGLDSTTAPDENLLHRIADWLNNSYKKDSRLAGIVYLFEITQPRVRAPLVLKNLAYFDKLCGSTATKNVILASTKWPGSPTNKELTREEDLTNIRPGSRVHRFANAHDSAWTIVNLILADAFTFDTAALQENLEQLRGSLKKHDEPRLINDLETLLQDQNSMAGQLKQSGGVQIGDGGLWDKLVKNEKQIRDTLGKIGRKVTLSQKLKTFFRLR